ncbi:hypothetical protein ANCCAN_10023 [Ancylostoma caninum]|uniref:Uncharacterized protein n=1 Tax=Ancylostoma caninum TaxID=29170 RepID=A0A368GHZ8_ANCCA|nr:hypothetical protein ANCCAN_10023 [Ancylostoma caninum]
MNQSYNILMTYIAPDSEYHIIDALKKTHAHLPMIVYMKFPESNTLQSYDRNMNSILGLTYTCHQHQLGC